MKVPGPDHPITIAPNRQARARELRRQMIADTTPRADAEGGGLSGRYSIFRAPTPTWRCSSRPRIPALPYKGDASYFTIAAGGRTAENAVWSYQQPFPAVAEIKDHLAFYPNRVDKIEAK